MRSAIGETAQAYLARSRRFDYRSHRWEPTNIWRVRNASGTILSFAPVEYCEIYDATKDGSRRRIAILQQRIAEIGADSVDIWQVISFIGNEIESCKGQYRLSLRSGLYPK